MNVLIVEDEIIASKRLIKLINECDPGIEILGVQDSILDTVNFLTVNTPDLIFIDIQLSDGICFEIFERMEINIPVIFTTAYDEYMVQAFKVNSIDYLLKPIRQEDINASIERFKKYNQNADQLAIRFQELLMNFIKGKKTYKGRFLIRSGRGFFSIDVENIAYFVSERKLNYIITKTGKRFVVDHTLDELIKMIDPMNFIKINRNYIISNSSIIRIEPYFNNRMILEVQPPSDQEILVSRSNLKTFKEWMDR